MKCAKIIMIAWVLVAQTLLAQEAILPDLRSVPEQTGWKLVNRAAFSTTKDGQPAVRLEDGEGIGIIWLEHFLFTNGTIELDIRGTNILQHSFVGVAFHGKDAQAYDAVYFRPFNFRSDDSARRQRAVQYISHPTWTWSKLRQEHPGKYEQPVTPVPDPNGWFHVRVVVQHPKVSVFVNDGSKACLVVEQLSDRKQGRIGFWVDNGGGEFANLRIRHERAANP